MRIVYLIDSLVPGGAEQSLAGLAPHYVASGVRLDVAYLHERPGLQAQLQAAGAHLHPLAGRGRMGWIAGARRLITSLRPDLVHTTLFEADVVGRIAAMLTRVPVVSSLVNPEYGPEQFADPRLKAYKVRGAQALDALTARTVVRFHAITRYVAHVMARRLRIRPGRIDVIPRGREARLLGERTPARRGEARRRIGIADDELLVLAAARQEYQKGLDVLLEAWPAVVGRVPVARLALAGREGDLTPQLRELAGGLPPDAVAFLGIRDDVPDLLCAADVFAFPSRWEGLGGVVLEAMALEAPIVATEIPAVRETVGEDGAAVLVAPERPDALAEAILDSLSDRTAAAERARRARARFLERYTLERVAEQMLAFYERALAST